MALETLLMEDFTSEGLELIGEVGVLGSLRGCRCLAAKDWYGFVGVVGATFPRGTSLRLELAVEAPGEGLILFAPFRGVTCVVTGTEDSGFVLFPFDATKNHY